MIRRLSQKEMLKSVADATAQYIEILENENRLLHQVAKEANALVEDVVANKRDKNIVRLMEVIEELVSNTDVSLR